MAKSSLMPNWRHIHLKLHGAIKTMDENEAKKELMKCLLVFFGVDGMSELQISVEKYDAGKKEFILRVLRGGERKLSAGMALIGEFCGVQARLETVKISGTIRALVEES